MRYQNWDVLLFPEASKIPIQEFKTTCHVIKDQDCPAVQTSPFPENTNSSYCIGFIPVLTTFVASLRSGEAFRVSVHSWQRPTPSQTLLSYMGPDDTVMFEARVYIDGVFVANHIFDHRTVWPVVIDRDNRFDTEGHIEPLRFPPFHRSILQQQYWTPGEHFGRIKVVITEGMARSYSPDLPHSGGFDRFRDVLAFSFQHAPTNVLEFSGISWPTIEMFKQARAAWLRPSPAASHRPFTTGHEAHSHSPRRATQPFGPNPMSGLPDCIDYGSRHGAQPSNLASREVEGPDLQRSKWANAPTVMGQCPTSTGEDPFMGPSRAIGSSKRATQAPARSTSHDVSMEDYISSKSSHSAIYTEMSDVCYPPKDFEKTMNEAAIEEIVKALSPVRRSQLLRALSPGKAIFAGTDPPNNTPCSLPLAGQTPSSLYSSMVNNVQNRPRNLSLEVCGSMNDDRQVSAASSDGDHQRDASRSSRCSASPSGSVHGCKEKTFAEDSERPQAHHESAKDEGDNEAVSRSSYSGTPLDDTEGNRRILRSNSTKRMKSLSKKVSNTLNTISPSTKETGRSLLRNSGCSPRHSLDISPQDGGVSLGP